MLKHIDRWFSFARGLGLGIDHMEEIILVTGYHSTRSWANVAFLEGRANAEASFGVNVVHGRDVSITWQFPFAGIRGAVCGWGPEGENLQETQCVFIRGFRAIRVLGPDKNLVLNSYNKSRDPLHVLMEYIVAVSRILCVCFAHILGAHVLRSGHPSAIWFSSMMTTWPVLDFVIVR
ncbi:hypothetical protein BC826DRAFT_621608 [Russula brevipes]|nr:hypothetical protein BC826DRAFT_621608 [Russula brevipes]